MMEGYTYQPLEGGHAEIRVLLFEPHSHLPWDRPRHSPIRCRVHHIDLRREEIPAYNAISYAWGTVSAKRTIYLNGQPLEVPESADVALRSLCHSPRHLNELVWIDAICIDQGSLREKNHQVAIMSEIYSKAETVLIWLGEADEDTPSAIDTIHTISAFCIEQQTRLQHEITGDDLLSLPLPAACDWAAPERFFSARWFRRAWVAQECTLAKKARCYRGKYSISWYRIAEVVTMIFSRYSAFRSRWPSEERSPGSLGLQNAAVLDAFGALDGSQLPMALIGLNLFFDCMDPKDRIFAFTGLINSSAKTVLLPPPDYTLSRNEIYTMSTRATIEATRSLYPLAVAPDSRMACDPADSENLPSWVPRYDLLSQPCMSKYALQCVSDASMLLPANFAFQTSDGRTLTVAGVSLGHVLTRGCPIGSQQSVLSAISRSELLKTEQIARGILAPWNPDVRQYSPPLRARLAKLADLFTAGDAVIASRLVSDRVNMINFVAFLWECRRHVAGDLDASFEDLLGQHPSGPSAANARAYKARISTSILGRRYFETSSGMSGLGSGVTDVADLVCILFGCEVPLLLRRRGKAYEIVSNAYVPGVLKASALPSLAANCRADARRVNTSHVFGTKTV